MQIKGTYREILAISMPIVLGSMAQSITQVVDTAFLGRVGEVELGANNIAGLYYMFLMLTSLGFTRGSQIIIARRTGAGDYEGVGQVFRHTLYLAAGLIFFFMVLLWLFTDDIFGLVLQSPEILQASKDYISFRIFGVPLGILNFCFLAFYTGIGKTNIITIATIALAIVNIIFDYVLIFGNFGAPIMGIEGAALASVLADGSMFLVYSLFAIFSKYGKFFHLFKFYEFSTVLFKRMMDISSPLVAQNVIGLMGWQLFFIVIEKSGVRALAISSISKSLYMFIGIPIWGLASSANTVVSNLLGQNNREGVMPAIKKIVNLSFLFAVFISIIMYFLPRIFLRIYTSDLDLLEDTIPVYNVILVAMFFFSCGSVMLHSIMGMGSSKTILLMEILAVGAYVGYLLLSTQVLKLSLVQIWYSEFVYWILICFLSFLYIRKKPWLKANFKTSL